MKLTYGGRSINVKARAVTTIATAARATRVEMDLERLAATEPMSMSFSLHNATYSFNDVTEISMRKVLFGEPGPEGVLMLGGSIPDPLTDLPAEPLPEESIRPILGLFLAEALVGSGRASRLTGVRLSSPVEEGRRIEVGWQESAPRGSIGGLRSIDGVINLPHH